MDLLDDLPPLPDAAQTPGTGIAPIASLSLGLPAVFVFGTPNRKDRTQRYRLVHGACQKRSTHGRAQLHQKAVGIRHVGDGLPPGHHLCGAHGRGRRCHAHAESAWSAQRSLRRT